MMKSMPKGEKKEMDGMSEKDAVPEKMKMKPKRKLGGKVGGKVQHDEHLVDGEAAVKRMDRPARKSGGSAKKDD